MRCMAVAGAQTVLRPAAGAHGEEVRSCLESDLQEGRRAALDAQAAACPVPSLSTQCQKILSGNAGAPHSMRCPASSGNRSPTGGTAEPCCACHSAQWKGPPTPEPQLVAFIYTGGRCPTRNPAHANSTTASGVQRLKAVGNQLGSRVLWENQRSMGLNPRGGPGIDLADIRDGHRMVNYQLRNVPRCRQLTAHTGVNESPMTLAPGASCSRR